MNPAKIRLSAKEMELVMNADWILTKNGVIQKVNHLLGSLQPAQAEALNKFRSSLPAEALVTGAKISKGENYKGLPYLVLDHPRYFDKENIFAVRTMFWWGHFFSVTLHLSGKYRQQFESTIIAAFSFLQDNEFFIATGSDEWEHHFEKDNYSPVKDMNSIEFGRCITQNNFVKLAQNIPLQQWDHAHTLLTGSFIRIMHLLAGQLPSR
jgi:hypothetical protein